MYTQITKFSGNYSIAFTQFIFVDIRLREATHSMKTKKNGFFEVIIEFLLYVDWADNQGFQQMMFDVYMCPGANAIDNYETV